MSQQTNLNVSPYFDDFDANNGYHKVLFKPGVPVQARELTTLQSILENQIEKFGQHFFKEGAKVIPGNTGYTALYNCVQLQNIFLGVPVAAYADQLVGTKITGQVSGVTAVVDKVLLPQDSERGNLTLYINYLGSSTQNNATQVFSDGESLVANTTISSGLLGNTFIASGQPFAVTLANNSTATGSSFNIINGVYYIRGRFINVQTETLILDQYSNRPNYRVGLFVNEEIINSDIDETLNDNSQGFNNYAAPGADRLKITTSLFKKSLDDYDDNNFIELATIKDGILQTVRWPGSSYNLLEDELARRTYNESGDYVITPFDVSVKESLNDNRGNQGIFNVGQFTYGGSTPSNDLAVYKISPGKAIVRGYEVESISTTFLDVEKPRTTKTLENQSINYNTGSTLTLNNVQGSPIIGVGNTYVLSLRDERVGTSNTIAPGKEIGVARVYDFRLESGSYSFTNQNLNEWNISLYDVQTITEITLNEPITLSVPTFVEGANSGARGFIKDEVSASNLITLYDTQGTFLRNESFIFDGIANGRVATAITSYGLSDVKSVYGLVGSASTFSADSIQSTKSNIGIALISAESSGISTITSPNVLFPGNFVRKDNLISYSDTSLTDPVLARVVSVGSTEITISGVTTVVGVAQGQLPNAALEVTDLKVLTTALVSSSDNTLYTSLPKNNISSVDLTNASLVIRKSFIVNITSNELSIPVSAGTNETFLPFDEERYSLIRSNGSTEILTSDRFAFIDGGKQLQIFNLGSNDTGATLTTTLRKIKPKAKAKRKNRVNSIIINKSKNVGSGIGETTLDDGLEFGNYAFGTRVQDKNISLNVPDIIEIHGIFESADITNPSAPKMVLSSINGPTNTTSDLIIGEEILGQDGITIAIVAEKLTTSQIAFIPKNDNAFREGETITFRESNIQAVITTLDSPSFNISSNYTFTTGQKGSFYDYGFIARKSNADEPNKKIIVYFSNGFYDSSDDGDITTVNSYNTFDYRLDIKAVNGIQNSDIIDIRPRVSSYSVLENSRSPFEFFGRTFNASGNSAKNILASDEAILTNFSFYLGRIDRIYLTKDGKFQVKYGIPAEKPEMPVSVDDALEIAVINLPAYLYSTSESSIHFMEHKRYRMVDIKQLENRIKNLEYYTSLSLLETNTSNLFVSDSNGLNRFKSGFFVDNFTSTTAQETAIDPKNSIDIRNKELRPKHYTTAVDLLFGPVENTDPTEDLAFSAVEGINIRKTGDIITLDYVDVEWLSQVFATRSESVTPFIVSFWNGNLELVPASDTWIDTVRLEAKIIDIEGDYKQTISDLNADPQTGFLPTIWGSWVDNWTGQEVVHSTSLRTQTSVRGVNGGTQLRGQQPAAVAARARTGKGTFGVIGSQTTTVFEDTVRQTIDTGVRNRTGVRTIVTEQFDQHSQGDRTVSRDLISFMRSRNIQFTNKNVKPLTQLYAFFDGVDVTKYCVPKLLEINMISGVFEVGETVIGVVRATGLGPTQTGSNVPRINFRVAQANHKEGPYNSPNTTYPESPYLPNVNFEVNVLAGTASGGTGGTFVTGLERPTIRTLPATYSSTSTILNIDTFSLSNEPQGSFSGYVEPGMILVGQTSGAQATITNLRLVSDLSATLIGSFFIPNPNDSIHPRFETGTKVLTFTNNSLNDQNVATTISEESFSSSGTLETVQENIISVRNARIEHKQEFEEQAIRRTSGTAIVNSRIVSSSTQDLMGWYDPIAQSFLVSEDTGIFLTRCDVFFESVDDTDVPVTIQLRTMQNGYPTQHILPFSEVTLEPNEIQVSSDGSVATPITFKAPVYLEGGTEYCVALASVSTKYRVFISRVGETDLLTQTFISNQPYLGSLFKSQNASTWEASQWEDLKFTLYRADFIESGTVEVYNPELSEGNNQIANLMPNSLNFNSKKVRISLASTINDSDFIIGNTVLQNDTNASGNYVGNAGIATGELNIINAGIGYTPSSGIATFSNVILETITGKGRDALAEVTISNGVAIGATITSGGSGYQIGDVLGISNIGAVNVGTNARFSLSNISNLNQIIVDNVQGDFVVGESKTIQFRNSLGITTSLNGTGVFVNEIITETDGLHIKVNHRNHGMYFDDNLVTISNAQSDIRPTKLSVELAADSTGAISVDNSDIFSTFENVGVGATNPGYLIIGNEVIEYTSASGGVIGGNITRGTNPTTHPIGEPVYKYELNGISLNRINKTHDLNNVTITEPITFDSYHIKLDMSSDGIDRTDGSSFPILYANQTKSSGGYNTRATQNIPFEIITPNIHNLTVNGTSISAEVNTITGSSISGNEIAFTDVGFEPITINAPNYLDSTRIIASKVNENNKLSNLPGNKSMNMRLTLGTTDSKVSPVIDTQRISTIFTSNRVNSVIEDYATDARVDSIEDDPSAFQYISKEITLENSASSIKIILDAHINLYSDIRAFYAISKNQNFDPIFTPFPGFNNINSRDQIIDPENSNGLPDKFISPSSSIGFIPQELEYREYTFTADELAAFRSYRIKLVMTSTSQVYVPRVSNLRVIALA
jgi:hypothetical protein